MTLPNIAPIARAGADVQLIISPGQQTVVLDGSRSRDPNGSLVAFRWRQVSGPTATIANPTQPQTVVSGIDEPGSYRFELTVTDNRGATDTDTMTVTATMRENREPVANAGADQQLQLTAAGATTVLNGTASADPDGDSLTFVWHQVSGPAQAVLQSPGSVQTTVQMSNVGVYEFELSVTDSNGATARDRVQITVTSVAAPCGPVANAGRDVMLIWPANATMLNGTASFAADGAIIAWSWEQIGGPAAGCASGHDTAQLALTGLVRGSYRFRLTVVDAHGRSAADDVSVTVGRNSAGG